MSTEGSPQSNKNSQKERKIDENEEEEEITDPEIELLMKEILQGKLTLALLKKKKRLLLEEIHRHCLEGELDPKKRLKPYHDKRKKLRSNVNGISSQNLASLSGNIED